MDPAFLTIRSGSHKTRCERLLFIPPELAEKISALPRVDALIWPWPWHPRTIWPRFRKLLKAAGIGAHERHGGLFQKMRRTSGNLVELAGGDGARHLGHSRAVFLKHYWCPQIVPRSQWHLLPPV